MRGLPLKPPVFPSQLVDAVGQLEKEVNATGSGVIVDAMRGYVLTANHVVASATAVQIRTKDGRKLAGCVVGRDAPTDIALLQIREPVGLKAIAFGDSDTLEEGRPRFTFNWEGVGGPPISMPSSSGFGSRLIGRVLEDDFGGRIEVSYAFTGLILRLTASLGTLSAATN